MVEVDERLWEVVRQAAADDVVPEDQPVEEALRRYVGLGGIGLVDELNERQPGPQPSDDAATALAIAEMRAARTALVT
jgi:hypothetical protein